MQHLFSNSCFQCMNEHTRSVKCFGQTHVLEKSHVMRSDFQSNKICSYFSAKSFIKVQFYKLVYLTADTLFDPLVKKGERYSAHNSKLTIVSMSQQQRNFVCCCNCIMHRSS